MTLASPERIGHPLERMLAAVDARPIVEGGATDIAGPAIFCHVGTGRMRRLTHGEWQLFARPSRGSTPIGSPFAKVSVSDGRPITAVSHSATGRVCLPFSFEEVLENYAFERWTAASSQRRLSPRLLEAEV
jgi:hypothetical protein